MSQAIQELSEITSGLNELLQSSAQVGSRAEDQKPAKPETERGVVNSPEEVIPSSVETNETLPSLSEGLITRFLLLVLHYIALAKNKIKILLLLIFVQLHLRKTFLALN